MGMHADCCHGIIMATSIAQLRMQAMTAGCAIICKGVEKVPLARFADAVKPWLLTSRTPVLPPSWATQCDHASAYLVASLHMPYAKSSSGLPHVGLSHT